MLSVNIGFGTGTKKPCPTPSITLVNLVLDSSLRCELSHLPALQYSLHIVLLQVGSTFFCCTVLCASCLSIRLQLRTAGFMC